MRDMQRFLKEDLGTRGDITTKAIIGNQNAVAKIFAKEPCIVAGLDEARKIFERMNLETRKFTDDGSRVSAGEEVLEIEGPAKKILAGERLVLNFIIRMSGIATITADVVEKCRKINPEIDIAATRKTTPGFRYYEKKAVILGGGSPHRLGLFDSILIKDNHLKIIGSIEKAVKKAKEKAKGKIVEVEVDGLNDAIAAVKAGADIIMLDNFKPSMLEKSIKKLKEIKKDILIEVSGGITPDNIIKYAKYADIISLGALTHSYKSKDFSLEIIKVD